MVPNVDAFRAVDVLNGRQTMPARSFLDQLPPGSWPLLVGEWGADSRVHERDEELPLGPADEQVHIVLGGCVRQERHPFGTVEGAPKITRFRGVGQLLGEAKLIEPAAAVRTTCLTTTWVMSCPVPGMNLLLRRRPHIQLALLRSLEDRNRTDEMIYGTMTRPPLERVCGLLVHLAEVAGTADTDDPGHLTILGPSQKDIADALLLGVSTVEHTLRLLRTPAGQGGLFPDGVLRSGYRRFVVTDLPSLRAVARIS
ncbi:Crp/Fnr family transcriptional regulator [Streptomyces sp. GbtcB6]|uniref:Crp/Fnr family transcriptional regulator n=1 Tax=Streptomyces sp. GbtcB6 TaxID=2824751 RepID=UPI0027E56006|nr:Crp/Fnr family transcriptional regulator [Streptomyces sp. GbtcB6]